jgi:hypothetical protein
MGSAIFQPISAGEGCRAVKAVRPTARKDDIEQWFLSRANTRWGTDGQE